MRALVFGLALYALAPIGSLRAQAEPSVESGARVRITAPAAGLVKRAGTLIAMSGGITEFRGDGQPNARRFETATVSRLEVSVGRRSLGAGRGALTGLLVGAGLGALLTAVSGDGGGYMEGVEEAGAFALAATGALIGTVVGAVVKKERWEDVPLDRLRVRAVVTPEGRFGVAASLRF